MKLIELYEKGEKVNIEMEITKVSLVGGQPQYELKDPHTGEFLDKPYTSNMLRPIKEESCNTEDYFLPGDYIDMNLSSKTD